jgi:phage I-like protein
MASAVLQNDVIMLPSHLNEALECQEMNKQLLRKLFKVKIFNDQRSAFLIESAKTELCEEKLKKKLQKQSEKEQQIGKNNLTIQNSYNDFLIYHFFHEFK